jgi:hypothetical protein
MADKFKPRVEKLLANPEAEPGAAELLAKLNQKLRDIEKAQIEQAQVKKVAIPAGYRRNNNMGAIWAAIEAARRKQK